MTFAPPTLISLQAFYMAHGGVNLGIVGDTAHQAKGTSYHLGKSDLIPGAYSARTARDRAGLSEAASAVDWGRLDGELTKLWAFSRWFAQQCFDENPAYRDVREVIFWSTVRNRVIGWSDLARGQWINDYGDLSHKTHTHISFYRDSEFRPKIQLIAPYFATPGVPDMPTFKTFATPKLVAIPKGGWIYDNEALATSNNNIQIDPARDLPVVGVTAAGVLIVGYRDATPTEPIVPTYYVKGAPKEYPAAGPASAVACKPFTDPLNATIAQLQTDLANAEVAGQRKEWDRQDVGATIQVELLPRP